MAWLELGGVASLLPRLRHEALVVAAPTVTGWVGYMLEVHRNIGSNPDSELAAPEALCLHTRKRR